MYTYTMSFDVIWYYDNTEPHYELKKLSSSKTSIAWCERIVIFSSEKLFDSKTQIGYYSNSKKTLIFSDDKHAEADPYIIPIYLYII